MARGRRRIVGRERDLLSTAYGSTVSFYALNPWLQPAITVLAAVVALTALILTLVIQRKAARKAGWQAERAAEVAVQTAASADRSAKAAVMAADAAKEAVGINRVTAASIAGRAESDSLSKRYQDAALQIGHDKAAVRLAGVVAMARLADDWTEQRQTCIDVLCAYLRMPSDHETIQDSEGEKQVRVAILRLIGNHLDADAELDWCDGYFDFSYAELPTLTWTRPAFEKRPDFNHTRFAGPVSIAQPRFEQGVSFVFATFESSFQIRNARVSGGDVALQGAEISSGVLTTDLLSEQGVIDVSRAICRGEFGIVCSPDSKKPQGRVALREVRVRPGGLLYLDGVDLEGADASALNGATSQPGAVIYVEPQGQVRLPTTFKEFSGDGVYNDVWKNGS